jgi:hypothetical protein
LIPATAKVEPMEPVARHPAPLPDSLLLPDYGGACLSSLLPGLIAPPGQRPPWLPAVLADAGQVVLLVLDGLGWDQWRVRTHLAPVLAGMEGGPISSVAPTTTATALCSITLGMPPAAHGLIGYKFLVNGPSGPEVLNVLRWRTVSGDARGFVQPRVAQPQPAFAGLPVPVVSRSDFAGSGFTEAHQRGGREIWWSAPSSIAPLVRHLLLDGERLIYAYYDGIDRVAHAAGLGELYDAELQYVDGLVGQLVSALPGGACLAVTADHGQVEVGTGAVPLAAEVASLATIVSGEGRFRWLHTVTGEEEALLEAAKHVYGHEAWVATRDEVIAAGVFGGVPRAEHLPRLGDIALVPLGAHAYMDPKDSGEAKLISRHGGLTREEVLVPLLASAGG